MIKYTVLKNIAKKFWQKKYFWIVYAPEQGVYDTGWAWTHNGACNEAEFYIDKLNDGRYFK
jgi:hypothetical protein